MSYLVYVVILFLSLHACSARHLGVTDKRIGRKVHLMGKNLVQDVRNRTLHITLAPTLQRSEPQEFQAQEKQTTGTGELKTLVTLALSNTLESSKAILKDKYKGREVAISYSQEYSQEATELEGWRRQSRSTLGSTPHKAEETLNSKENDVVEDIVVMDYAQPHRKPPIHNIKP